MTMHDITAAAPARSRTPASKPRARTLLLAGAVAGPLFYLSAIAQMATREGFDLRVHPISQLSTGEWGWIQVLTFAIAGAGLICLALGHRAVLTEGAGRAVIPLLLGIAGLGFIAAGLFPQDPSHGFPVGAPSGPATETTWHALVHAVAAIVGFTAIAIAAVVALVRAIRERRPMPAVGHAIVALALLAPVSPEIASVQVAVTGLFAFGWCTATAIRLLRTLDARRSDR